MVDSAYAMMYHAMYDRAEPEKQRRSWDVLKKLAASGTGVISTQILAEFFAALTRKLAAPLSAAEAYPHVENYARSWPIVKITGFTVLEAIDE